MGVVPPNFRRQHSKDVAVRFGTSVATSMSYADARHLPRAEMTAELRGDRELAAVKPVSLARLQVLQQWPSIASETSSSVRSHCRDHHAARPPTA